MKKLLIISFTFFLFNQFACTKIIEPFLEKIGIIEPNSPVIMLYRFRKQVIIKNCGLNDCNGEKTVTHQLPVTEFKALMKSALYLAQPHRHGLKDVDDSVDYEMAKIKQEIKIDAPKRINDLKSFLPLEKREKNNNQRLKQITTLLKNYHYNYKDNKAINRLIAEYIDKLIYNAIQEEAIYLKNFTNKEPVQTGIKFIDIPAGTFTMGNDSEKIEKPAHQVTVTSFKISETEITQEQWQKVMGTTPWKGRPFVREGNNYPAVYISWHAVKNFIARLNNCPLIDLDNIETTLASQNTCQKELQKANHTIYRLPSEAEWEYAARQQKKFKGFYHFAALKDRNNYNKYAWYYDNTWSIGEKYAHTIKSKLPNGYGLYGIIGNVMEWMEDAWHGNYEGAPSDGSPWSGKINNCRVIRGCSWNIKIDLCRPTFRTCDFPDDRFSHIGFRLVTITTNIVTNTGSSFL